MQWVDLSEAAEFIVIAIKKKKINGWQKEIGEQGSISGSTYVEVH